MQVENLPTDVLKKIYNDHFRVRDKHAAMMADFASYGRAPPKSCEVLFGYVREMLSGADGELLQYTLENPGDSMFDEVYRDYAEGKVSYKEIDCIYNAFTFYWLHYRYH